MLLGNKDFGLNNEHNGWTTCTCTLFMAWQEGSQICILYKINSQGPTKKVCHENDRQNLNAVTKRGHRIKAFLWPLTYMAKVWNHIICITKWQRTLLRMNCKVQQKRFGFLVVIILNMWHGEHYFISSSSTTKWPASNWIMADLFPLDTGGIYVHSAWTNKIIHGWW